jgi:hypothetical protein
MRATRRWLRPVILGISGCDAVKPQVNTKSI